MSSASPADGVNRGVIGHRDGQSVLMHSVCPSCGEHRYPPRVLCPNDLSEMDRVELSSTGTLVSVVDVRRPPYGFESTFWSGYVDMPEGVRVFGQLVGEEQDLVRGRDVAWEIEVVRVKPVDVEGPVFRPVDRDR